MRVVFGRLQSDQPDLLNGDLETAENCVPYTQSYGPFPDPVAYSASAPATVRGAYSTKDLSGNVYTFVATETQMYKESATVLNNVSRTATYTTGTDIPAWDFETFGNTLLATNGIDPIQVYTLGTSSQFKDMSASASAPVAQYLATVRDFLFTGCQPTAKSRVQWSRINNPLRFTPSQRFQSDYQDLPGTDQIIKNITGGDFACILTNTSVWRATYVGSPLVFRFDEVARNVGCYASGSAARFQNMTFFLAPSGMYVFDGDQCQPIGYDQIDATLLADLNTSYLHRVISTIDPVNKLYLMAYPSSDSTDGTPNRIAIYSWITQRWTFIIQQLEVLFNHMTGGYTLENLDALGTLDSLAFSLDSAAWQGGLSALSCVDTSHRIARFTGSPKTARFVTGEAELVTDARAFIRSLRPLVQGDSTTSITSYVGGRDRLIDSVTWSAASVLNATGTCPVRSNARYHRLKMEVSGGFERVIGSEVEWTKEGIR
jgi:hypothetical protein